MFVPSFFPALPPQMTTDVIEGGRDDAASTAVAVVGGGSLPAAYQESSSARGFTKARNPFLFPLSLLDGLSNSREHRVAPIDGSDVPEPDSSMLPANCADAVHRWWLMHVKPRQEKKLAEELRRQGVQHFLPVTPCKAVTRGRTRITHQPLFPGYLFLHADAEQRLRAIKTNRIVTSIEVNDEPLLAEQLWDLADFVEKGVPLRREEQLVEGEHVRVRAGLLKDHTGIVIKRGSGARLFVRVASFLGGVSVEIQNHLLEPY